MVSITKLAFAIAITQQPLYAVGISEQAGLSRDQFEGIIKNIPDSNLRKQVTGLYEEKKYYDLEVSLVQYLEEYMKSSFKGEEREVVESKKEKVIDGVVDFIENAAEAEGLGNGAMDIRWHSFEEEDNEEDIDEDEDKPMAQINRERAIAAFKNIIDNYVIPSKKEEAENLLEDQEFTKLEWLIKDNVDPTNRTKVFNMIHGAKDFLWHSLGVPGLKVPDSSLAKEEDSSLSKEEDMLYTMESSLAETKEEIEELIAQLNKNREN